MSNLSNSILEVLTNQKVIDSRIRNIAAGCVKRYLIELIEKHKIDDVEDEDIEELSFDLVDELAVEDYSFTINN